MPHKHKRRAEHLRGTDSDVNLAPTEHLKPFPVGKPSSKTTTSKSTKPRAPSKPAGYKDDTPRAFARALALQSAREDKKRKPPPSDETTAPKPSKRSKSNPPKPSQPAAPPPRILPGEKLSAFSARVDAALPLSTVPKRRVSTIPGMKERQTRTEKRLQRMQAEWRVVDAKIREKEAEARDAQELEDVENGVYYERSEDEGEGKSKKKKGRKGKKRGLLNDDEEDPWAVLKARRPAAGGLNDVVQGPPVFSGRLPTEKFKVRAGMGVDMR